MSLVETDAVTAAVSVASCHRPARNYLLRVPAMEGAASTGNPNRQWRGGGAAEW